jgi:hypothetical protein
MMKLDLICIGAGPPTVQRGHHGPILQIVLLTFKPMPTQLRQRVLRRRITSPPTIISEKPQVRIWFTYRCQCLRPN